MFHAFAIEDIQKFNFDLCLLWQVKQQVGLYFPTLSLTNSTPPFPAV